VSPEELFQKQEMPQTRAWTDGAAKRPCLGVIEVPVEAIDGAAIVDVVLRVHGKGDEFIILEMPGVPSSHVCVRSDQLEAALRSLAVLRCIDPPVV